MALSPIFYGSGIPFYMSPKKMRLFLTYKDTRGGLDYFVLRGSEWWSGM